MEKPTIPEWIKRAKRNARKREWYFMRKYGSLDRMHAIDDRFQKRLDDESFDDEMRECGLKIN